MYDPLPAPSQIVVLGTPIPLAQAGPADAPIALVHVHANEQTAWAAAQQVAARTATTRAHSVAHGATRTLTCGPDEVDPNRVFSGHPLGAALVDAWGLRRAAGIVAAHNNRADRALTIDDFAAGGRLARDAVAVARGRGDPHAFFLVTTRWLFAGLAGENRVLQSPIARDDGSLSVWAARAGVPYVNAEALHDDVEDNVRRLLLAVGLFG